MTLFCVSVFAFSLTPQYHMPHMRKIRGSLFLLIGICAGVPIFHLIIFHNKIKGFSYAPKYHYWYIGGIIYVLGGLIYVIRCPEKYVQGIFDYFGASHQYLHIAVNISVILHYLGSMDAYYYRLNYHCPA